MIWLCRDCNAYVGCHNNTRKPKGFMANKEIREWRKKAHLKFDPIWKSGKLSRARAYGFLARRLGYDVHIGDSDVEQCKSIINLIETDEWLNKEVLGRNKCLSKY